MVDIPDEVPVGDTSVVCFKYTLEGNLCEVGGQLPHALGPRVPVVYPASPFCGLASN